MSDPLPLCVDLDGSLIRTDLLVESALALLHRNPLYMFAFAFWLLRGKAHLKKEIAQRAQVDVTLLPYDARVLERIRTEAAERPVMLCTTTDRRVADAVAAHVGGFSAVLASDGQQSFRPQQVRSAMCPVWREWFRLSRQRTQGFGDLASCARCDRGQRDRWTRGGRSPRMRSAGGAAARSRRPAPVVESAASAPMAEELAGAAAAV